jgi:hypothetical protein
MTSIKSAAFYIGKNPASRKNSYQTVGINILKVHVLCFKINSTLIRKDKRNKHLYTTLAIPTTDTIHS